MPDAASPVPPAAASGAAPPAVAPVRICASGELLERGRGVVFDVEHFRAPARGFALRFEGRVVAYLNRCVHVPTELDWNPGDFLDAGREFILCAVHGAAYAPQSGRCIGGPCGRGGLLPLAVRDDGVDVWWQPTADTRVPGRG